MNIDKNTIQKLRVATGAGIMDAKRALEQSAGKIDAALAVLRKRGQVMAVKKQDRETKQGIIGFYVHSNNKVAALVALACESDFVEKTKDFQELAHDLAMQVAAADPQYISTSHLPPEVIAKEKEIYRENLKREKKPEKIWDKIIAGKLEKYYSKVCLLKQPFIKEDKKTIEQLIQEKILKLGENIQIKEIKRMIL